MLTPQDLLYGIVYTLEQCGLLLWDARMLYENGAYASAIGLAAFAWEELGKSCFLQEKRKEAVEQGKNIPLEEIEKREAQPTQVHPGVPMPNDLAGRLLSLLPELEAMVARECDCQRLLSTPIGTPRHTLKKTYVVDTLYIDLIGRYARAEGLELKDVVNLALHEFFEWRHYLPQEA